MAGCLKEKTSDYYDHVCKAANTVWVQLGSGLTENAYRNALAVELEDIIHQCDIQFTVCKEVPIPIYYKNKMITVGRVDLFVKCIDKIWKNNDVIIMLELKYGSCTTATMTQAKEQLAAYMRHFTPNLSEKGIDIGLVVFFPKTVSAEEARMPTIAAIQL